jgi:propionate catabolism operon transcriptional regulator
MQPYKICCLTYKSLHDIVKKALSQYVDPEIEFSIIEGTREELLPDLYAVENAGCEVIIAGGANAQVAREYSRIPVINYRLTEYDYLEAVDKAIRLGGKIALCTYRQPMETGLKNWLEKKKIPYSNIIYEGAEDLKEQMLAHRGETIIGLAFAVETARELGYNHVLIYREDAVLASFFEAKMLAMQLRRQNEKIHFAQAVIENSTDGLALIDGDGIVIDCNGTAQNIWRVNSTIKGSRAENTFKGSGFSRFCKGNDTEQTYVCKVRDMDVLCRWIRLTGKSQVTLGFVGMFSNMTNIVKAQYEYQEKQRQEHISRGFSAKSCFHDIIGSSEAIKAAREDAKMLAKSDANILLSGETGVGKEIFAQSIHNVSRRRKGTFIAVNCATLPEHLLESELFGYDEGAFTGSRRGGKKGLFELADGGSIFLDEIGELSPVLQTRLLRVLQEHEIMHIGGDRIIPVNVRVLSSTNVDLEKAEAGRFRRDLYYRLSVLELFLPPLRKRHNDSVELFRYFLKQKGNLSVHPDVLPNEVIRVIQEYTWPGNIRELQNVCERFVMYLTNSTEQNEKHLRRSIVYAIGEDRLLSVILEKYNYPEKNMDMVVSFLREILGFNKAQIGEKLGVSRTTLWRKTR